MNIEKYIKIDKLNKNKKNIIKSMPIKYKIIAIIILAIIIALS